MVYALAKDYDDVRVVTVLVEALQFNNYEEVFNKIKTFISDDFFQIVLDMEKVRFMDSLSLGMLVPVLLYTKRLGGALKIANLDDGIQKLFEILQLNKIIEVHKSVEEAVNSF